MNWEAVGAIGEIIGAIAVVVTLIYLAVQVHQNTKSVQASTYQLVAEALADTCFRLVGAMKNSTKVSCLRVLFEDMKTCIFNLDRGTLRKKMLKHSSIR
jgi:uncharacterized protein with PQ loop repeat